MKKMNVTKKFVAAMLAGAMVFGLVACGGKTEASAPAADATGVVENAEETETETVEETATEGKTFKVGICNYVDDASLNQIVENIENQLKVLGDENGVTFEIAYDNCNADATVMNQIIANFQADQVDLMVGVATPVAMAMQAATEGTDVPVIFAAVSDPEGAGLVESNAAPGANITGTSDYLDTNAIMNLIFAQNPDAKKIGFLYDQGQDSSTTPIANAKAYLDEKGIEYVDRTGTTTDEVMLAADALIADGVDAIFTPTDNTIMTAELSIYEKLADAKIPHYTGADSFALNGAFLGYGVDYANLGVETANMIAEILVKGANPATTAVKTFDNGTATINTETCEAIGIVYDEIAATFAPMCTQVNPIQTAESFE
ncbi:MAG: ABC transporter substrate-binding protein [Lachnospiraceae bacterium]|nr:ABC transporter substrate-binding protein [Lachnospiraceae bacterium]